MRETGCTEVEVVLAVRFALERFRGARIQEFVTPFAERDARRQLREEGAGACPPQLKHRTKNGLM
jgi:hypothetical protein